MILARGQASPGGRWALSEAFPASEMSAVAASGHPLLEPG